MRKYVALFIAFALLLGLAGCSQESSYSVDDLLILQAQVLSRQVGMSAEASYLTAISTPSQIISRAEIFLAAAQTEALSGKLLREVPENFQTTISQICATVSDANNLALSSILTKTEQLHFPQELAKPAAVYLRYSEDCHFVVLFTPVEDGTVALWAYPLFADTAERLLEQHFANAIDLTGEQIRSSCEKAANAKFEATCPGKDVNAARYAAMAQTIFSQAQPLSKEQIVLFTNDEDVIAQAQYVSELLIQPANQIAVYRFGNDIESQINQVLSKTSYRHELEAHIRKAFFLSAPNQYCNAYGAKWVDTSSVLQICLNQTPPGMSAEADEEPVLVLMGFGDSHSVVLTIYPNQYHTYQYNFRVLPVPYQDMQLYLSATDMKPMQ